MLSLSHESLFSKPDKNGFCQRLSIDALRFWKWSKHGHTSIYKAKAFSDGKIADDKHEKKMLVKFLKATRHNRESRDFTTHYVNLNAQLQTIALQYNTVMKNMGHMKKLPGSERRNQIQFQELQMGQLDSVSFWNRKRREGEYFIFAQILPFYRVFLDVRRGLNETTEAGNKRKRSKSVSHGDGNPNKAKKFRTYSLRDSYEEDVESTYQCEEAGLVLHAFVHFYFSKMNGKMVIDCLRGSYSDASGYTLITPTVHSLTGDFGPDDGGVVALKRVVASHRCNEFCSHIPSMKDLLNSALRNGKEE